MRRCRNIIRLIEVYDSDLQVQIVMTYADLGTLKNIYIADQTPLPEDEVKPIMQQLLQGLADMHAKSIVHRDIKPENVLLKSSNNVEGGRKVCLADLGIACLITDERLTSQLCGTPGFIDPFLLNQPELAGDGLI